MADDTKRAALCVAMGIWALSCALEREPKLSLGPTTETHPLIASPESDAQVTSNRVAVRSAASKICPSFERADPNGTLRTKCTFQAGASVAETLGFDPTERARLPLRHVIVMMKENRSYDHLFGQLYLHGQPDSEPVPDTFLNLDANGNEVRPFHGTTTCYNGDPKHQWSAMHAEVNGGAMDGFVRASKKPWVMAFFDDRDIPFYYFLANTFAIADRYFASVRSGTWPNRDYLLLGTSDHVRSTEGGLPSSDLPNVFSQLDSKGISWGVYSVQDPFEGCLGWTVDSPNVSTVDRFFEQLADGSLPNVVFVDSSETGQDEHPPGDLQTGEAWSHRVYDAARASVLWPSLALLYTYDEAGGFADHVPPPDACLARPEDHGFTERGPRVPLIVISRFARPHYVSHLVHDHTSILRFIQLVYDLPALTARDANSDALLDMFDFECPNDDILPPPPPGRGGCTDGYYAQDPNASWTGLADDK